MMCSWIIIALMWLTHSVISEECPSGERWTRCVGACTDCWRRGRCEQPFCEAGCDCLPGHFRDDWGECVPEAWCPSDEECGANEEYSDCAVPCNTCEQRGDCEYVCLPGCDCKHGFRRDSYGTCVAENSCAHSACGTNEAWVECARPAWCATCEVRGNCGMANCTRGCDCLPGYYRNHDQTCVPEYKCPRADRCPMNEQYYSCMPDCTHLCKTGTLCAAVCRPGCFCRPGLVRREDGRCVRRSQCLPESCNRDDEEYYSCKPFCTAVCGHRGVCPLVCIPGCFCKRGLLLRNDGACVLPAQCTSAIPTPMTVTTTSMPDFLIGRRLGGDIDDVNATSIRNSSTIDTTESTSGNSTLSASQRTESPTTNSSSTTSMDTESTTANTSLSVTGSTEATSGNTSLPVIESTTSPASNVSLSATESTNSTTSVTSSSPTENTNVTASNASISSTVSPDATTASTSPPSTETTALSSNTSAPTTESTTTSTMTSTSPPLTMGASPEATPTTEKSSAAPPVPTMDTNSSSTQLTTTDQTPSTPTGGGTSTGGQTVVLNDE